MNAFVCLRVGYATIEYLKRGTSCFDSSKDEVRRLVRSQAKKSIVGVLKEGIVMGYDKGIRGIGKLADIM